MADSTKYTSKLSTSHILIIGGTSGIGYCVAEACLENGATVSLASSSPAKVSSAISSLLTSYPSANGRLSGHACDLASPSLEENIQALLAKVGQINHIVFTAGDALSPKPLEDTTLEKIQQAAMVRFNAPLLLAKHARAYLPSSPASSITLTTGAVSQRPLPNWSIMASYAAGLHGMTRNLALDLAPIRVNLVNPGAVETPLWDGMDQELKEAMKKGLEARLLTGRMGKPEDVAEAYLYAMRDGNCTGSVIGTDGGELLV